MVFRYLMVLMVYSFRKVFVIRGLCVNGSCKTVSKVLIFFCKKKKQIMITELLKEENTHKLFRK